MKNSLLDLNNVLFEQLERLNDDNIISGKEGLGFDTELRRAKAIETVSKQIIDNARVALDAKKYFDEFPSKVMPEMLITQKES